jgi:hypothetical protein
MNANGNVLIAPIENSVQPTVFRRDSGIRSANNRATPAPSKPRVPAMIPTSGIVNLVSRMIDSSSLLVSSAAIAIRRPAPSGSRNSQIFFTEELYAAQGALDRAQKASSR